MQEFEVLADAVRRRILDVLSAGEQPAGMLVEMVQAEFEISQPAVSQHLKVLRENSFATARAEGNKRFYALDPTGFDAALAVIDRWRQPMRQRLDALHTEIARGQHDAARRAPQERDAS